MLNKGKKGISLIVLVITVVVIVVLATAIIINVVNTNVIDNSKAAVFKSDVSNMKDELSMYIAEEYTDSLGKYQAGSLQATEEGIWYGSSQEEGTITDIITSMDEKYAGKLFIQDGKLVANKMTITVEEEKWLNELGINSTYQTDIGKLNILPSTTDWTNGNVELEISYTKEIPTGYAIEYKINNENWQEGTRVVVEENNTKVTTRLYSKEKNNEALSNSYTVSKIDKEVPDITNMKIDITAGINSITATASGATDSLSGEIKYKYSINNSTWQDSGTFSGIKSGTATTVYAKAIDKVGNESASVSNKGTTTAISGTVAIAQNPAAGTWTKGNVTVTLSYSNIPSGYVMQYKLGSGSWTAYSSALTISENNTVVTARLYNSSVNDEVSVSSKTIANIDKVAPDITAMKVTLTATENTITAVASGATDSLSGEIKYKYSINNSTWQDSGTFGGIKSGTATTVYAKAIDKVGNESASVSNKGTTTAISGTVAIAQNPAAGTWTKGSVTVTLSYANIPTGYVMQYKLGTGNWTAYSSALTISENNTKVTARLYNSSVNDEVSVSSKTIANIDKVAPDITAMKVTLTSTENTIIAVASGATDNLSGLSKYQYSINNSTWQDSGTFSGIKSGTATTVYAKAIDKVGNDSSSVSNKGTTTAISGTVSIAQNPAAGTWTKGNVTVTLSYSNIPSGYVMQYKLGSGNWTAYSSALTISENNTVVTARLYNSSVNDEVSVSSKTIANIDKVAPDITNMKVTLTATENTITAVASGATDSLSGLSKYQYSINNSTWQDSGTFSGIKSGTATTVYAKAIDKVGNESASVSNKGTTTSISGTVSIAQNPAAGTWTKGNVTVTLSYSNIPSGYVMQYKLGSGSWTAYSSALTISENNTVVTARLYNSNVNDEVSVSSKTIANIDKVVPTTPTSVSITVGTNSVTATATGSSDTLSGLSKYQYSLNNSTWQDSGTFSGIKSGTQTTVYARAVDKVGNVSGSISNKGTTSSIGAVTITQSPTAWTSGNVTVTLSHVAVSGYTLQYKIGNGAWTTYSSALTITDNNTTVYGRMYNATLADEGNSAVSKNIANIDKVVPTTPTSVSITVGTNSVTATATGSSDTLSGFSKYQYSLNNSTWQDSGTFSGIKSGTATTVYARAVDKVGNVSGSISNKGTTTSLGAVTITQNPAAGTWTKGNVTVTLSHAAVDGYTLQYKIGSGSWTTYSSALTITDNNTTVYGRMYNATLADEGNSAVSKNIANIDKVAPVTPTSVSITVGTNSVTATATGSSDTLSGFSKYQYSKDNSTWQDSGTFSGIKSGTQTTVYARAVDKVGNVSGSISNKGTTSSIGAVTITPSTTAWTKGNVTVTLSHAAVSGYTLQYKIGTGAWTTYSSALTITDNNTVVYGRMYNSTLADEGNSAASKTIANIDKVAPVTPTSVSITVGTNSVTATATGSSDTLSGFSKYQYSLNNSTWQDSGTFSGIKSGTATTVYARAVDKVGNVSGSKSNTGTTTSITGAVTITPSTTAWTSGNVTVTLSYANIPTGYAIQYKLGTGSWTAYSSAITISTNNTTVYARLYNSTASDEVATNSKAISNIDKVAPVVTNMTISLTSTSNSITATASGATDALSGFSKYQYSKDNSTWQDSATFSSLNPATAYTVYVRAVDKVGNVSSSKSSSVTTQKQTVTLGLSATSGTITYPSKGTFTVTSNPSGGTLSVKSSNTAVATVSISGTTVTITPGTTAGSATITVTSAATTTANAASATYTVTVKNGTLSVSASGYSGTYNGSAHGISVSCSGATIKYGTSSGSYTLTSSPTYTNAGTYTVYYQVSKAGYTTVTGSKQVVISKANGSVTLSATSGTIEKSKTTTFTVKTNTSGGGLSVSSSNTNVATASISGTTVTVTGKTTAGKSTITVTSAATTNYNAASATYTISVTNPLLRNVVSKGDYVNYPVTYTNVGQFCSSISTLTGWRVLYIYDNCVYLVSAGTPLSWNKTYTSATTASALVSWGLNSGNFTKYVNSTYAQSSRLLAKDDLDYFNGTSLNLNSTYTNDVIKIGGVYALATASGSNVYWVWYNGLVVTGIHSDFGATQYQVPGLRLIIKLKSDIRTTGKNSSGVWQMTTATGL